MKKTLFNIKGAGRPAIHDRGVRHIARDEIKRNTVLHLTIKIQKNKTGLRNKNVLKVLHGAIKKARLIGLRIIHYTLEYDHVHLMVEADNNLVIGRGMQSFGIAFSKGINRIKETKGQVFKTRYHFRKLNSPKEVRNALHYIIGNSTKHRSALSALNPFNSLLAFNETNSVLGLSLIEDDNVLKIRNKLFEILSPPKHHFIKVLT